MRTDPIFITGVYRSGTTLLTRILDAHEDLNVTYDSVNYFRYVIKKKKDASEYAKIVKEISERLNQRYGIDLNEKKIIEEIESHTNITHAVIYDSVMRGYFSFSNKRWGDKTLLEWTNIPVFLSMFPNGKVIHIIRDPRDVMISYRGMTIEPGNRYLDSIFANMSSYDHALEYCQILSPERYFLLEYNDLITDKEATVKKICAFLSVEFNETMLNDATYKDFLNKKFTKETHSTFPNEKGLPVNRWKNEPDSFDVKLVESILHDRMTKLGYEVDEKLSDNMGQFISIFKNDSLLSQRLSHFLNMNSGVEAYPSDPTKKENWGDTNISGKGAAVAYGRS